MSSAEVKLKIGSEEIIGTGSGVGPVNALDKALRNNFESSGYSDVIKDLSPKYVIMGHSYMVRDFLPRVSAKLDIPFVSDIISVTYDGDSPVFARQVFNAKLATNIQSDSSSETTLLSFQSAAFSSDNIELGGSDAATVFEVNINSNDIKSSSEPEFQESASGVDLTTADIIVSCLLYTSPSPRDMRRSRMPSSA